MLGEGGGAARQAGQEGGRWVSTMHYVATLMTDHDPRPRIWP